jgi:flavin-dependent dehydrogenase
MADASFDAVVIGGGQQGLVISNYLAFNGMSVGVFEKHNELGGAACSSPVPAPGFIGNPHAEHLGISLRQSFCTSTIPRRYLESRIT